MSATCDKLAFLFEQYGWIVQQDDPYVMSGLKTDEGEHVLVATMDKEWLSMSIPQFLGASKLGRRELIQLLVLNDRLRGAKIGIVDDYVSLSIDLPARNLEQKTFEMGLESILHSMDSINQIMTIVRAEAKG